MKSDAPLIRRFSISNARKAQIGLSQKVIREDRLPRKPRFVAGVDVAYLNNLAIGAVAVLDYETLELLESQIAVCEAKFPYIPTLLSFREIPPAVGCIRKLRLSPDVFLVDGQGIAHPYGCGFASHLGLVIGKPTVGVAKSRLIGKPVRIGEDIFLVQNGKIIGSVVTTREGSKPVIVSIGHKVSLETAAKIVNHCVLSNQIPEPLLQAHNIATREKKDRISSANRHDP